MTTQEIKKAFSKEFPQFIFSVTKKSFGYSASINITIKNFDKWENEVVSKLISFKDSLRQEKVLEGLGGNSYVNLGYKNKSGTTLFPDFI